MIVLKKKETMKQYVHPSVPEKMVKESSFACWPISLRDQIVRTFKRPINVERANEFFDKHDWPQGFRQIVVMPCFGPDQY